MSERSVSEEPYWFVEVFHDEPPYHTTDALITAPNQDVALRKAFRLFQQFETWRISVRLSQQKEK